MTKQKALNQMKKKQNELLGKLVLAEIEYKKQSEKTEQINLCEEREEIQFLKGLIQGIEISIKYLSKRGAK